jgi:hypothetical protein
VRLAALRMWIGETWFWPRFVGGEEFEEGAAVGGVEALADFGSEEELGPAAGQN